MRGDTMNELKKQTIGLYSKQLRVPMFHNYSDVIRQLEPDEGYEDFLIHLMKQELDSRQESTRKRKIKAAAFPYVKTMDELDVSRFEHMDGAFIKELSSCDFVTKKQNIVMIGNPGTGKTHLSIALGVKACMQGMNVKFYTAANLSNELIEAQDNHRLVHLEKQISKADLLIIDELSYLTFNRHQSELLFKVVADRAERKSVIVSTNLRFSEWTSMFENQTMVTALIDRLTFRSHVLNMNSDNPYRAEHAAVVSDDGKEADS
jgi:DNA replication protein DnaC